MLATWLHGQHAGDNAADLDPDELIESVLHNSEMTKEARAALAVLHAFFRESTHDRFDTLTHVVAEPAVDALRVVTDWLFPEGRIRETIARIWDSLPIGASLGERLLPGTAYRLREPALSYNSLGPLFPGTDTEAQEPVTINVVLLPSSSDEQFFAEANRFRQLSVPNVVAPIDAGRVVVNGERRCLYLVLPPVDGVSVDDLPVPLPERAAYELGYAVATALIGFHDASPPIVHGDIRPANVLLRAFGNVSVLCIGHQIPHQRDGRALTPRTDLAGLRAMLVYLLTGQHAALDGLATPQAALRSGSTGAAVLARLAESLSAVSAAAVLRDAAEELADGMPGLKQLLPQPTRPALDESGPLHLVDLIEVRARRAWPLGDTGVLVWGRADDTLAVVRRQEQVWRDDRPVPVRKVVAGPVGSLAVGGWNGAVRLFLSGTAPIGVLLDGAVGDMRFLGPDLIVGSWKGSLCRITSTGTVHHLLNVHRGVHRIAVSARSDRFAVADQSGGLVLYSGDRPVDTLSAQGPIADIAYAGSRLIVLSDEAVGGVRLNGTRTEPVASPGAIGLRSLGDPAYCLLLVSTITGDDAGEVVQASRIDDGERRLAAFTLPAGQTLLSINSAGDRCTVARSEGGCAYRRAGAEVLAWPDAVAAHVSEDGRRVAVVRPERVDLFEDPA
jgi:hypothetical protein